MAKLNYATEYLQTLEQMFPYVLYFGDLFATPNNGRFRWVNSRVIEVPTISTTGRTDGDRDTIGTRKRNYNNEWKPLTLENHRQWQTLVHPMAVITPISYEFAQLDPPSAGSQGKYDYFEESFEDVFILPHKMDAIDFHVNA